MAEDKRKPLPAADRLGTTTLEPVRQGEAPSTDLTKHAEAAAAAGPAGAEARRQHRAEPTIAEGQGSSPEETRGVQQDPEPGLLRHDPGSTTTTSTAAASTTAAAREVARKPSASTARSRQEVKTKDRRGVPPSNKATSVLQQGCDSSSVNSTAASPAQRRGIAEDGVPATTPSGASSELPKEELQQQQQGRYPDSSPHAGARQQSPRSVEVPETSGGSVPVVVVPESSKAKQPSASSPRRAPPGSKDEASTGQSQPAKVPLKGRDFRQKELGPDAGGAATVAVTGSAGRGGSRLSEQSNRDPEGPEHQKNTTEEECRPEHGSGGGGQGKKGVDIEHRGKEDRGGGIEKGEKEEGGGGGEGHDSSEGRQRKDQEGSHNEVGGQSAVVAKGGEGGEESEIHTRSASALQGGSQSPPAAASAAAASASNNEGDTAEQYQRQPRAMPKWEERSSRPTVRASMQVTRSPPLTIEALPPARAPFNPQGTTNTVYTTMKRASVVAGPREGEWQDFAESQQAKRQHSTPDLVPRRRHSFNPRLSLELFEEPSSDNDSPRAASDGATPEDGNEDQIPEKEVPWELSAEGKSRIATLKKATVKTSAKMMTRKYLKLFVPLNSVGLFFNFC